MIILKIGFTLDFGIISSIPRLDIPRPALLKPHAGGQVPYLNIEIGKLNNPTISKIIRECSSLYKILGP